MSNSELEAAMEFHIRAVGLPMPVREFKFYPGRNFRADFAWPGQKLLLEVEGGGFVEGRHNRGVGMQKDCEKYNLAALAGWMVLRVTDHHISTGKAISWLEEALKLKGENHANQ